MTTPAYGCQLQGEGETHQVAWLITHLNPPGTISLCDDDFAIGIIHLLATDLGADPERLYDTVKRFTDREKARQDKEAAQAEAAAVDGAPAGPDEPGDRCESCGRMAGMPTAPCESCPDYAPAGVS